MHSDRDEYVAKVKLQLDELNASVDVLESHMHKAKVEARASYAAELAKLRLESERVSDKLAQIRITGEETWDKMVQEMDKVRDAFKHSLSYFKSQF